MATITATLRLARRYHRSHAVVGRVRRGGVGDVGDTARSGQGARLTGSPAWLPVVSDNLLELLAVVMLSVASLGAAWAGYQASQWGGEQTLYISEASATRLESSRSSTIGYLLAVGDLTIFNAWAEAVATDNQALMTFNENRFGPELATAVADWRALDPLNDPAAPGSPFEENLYTNQFLQDSVTLEAEATRIFDQGRVANDWSDQYVLVTVIFAMVLFFGGISSRVTWYPAKLLVLTLGVGFLAYGAVRLATFPVL
jgi:hypothetical protein